MIHPVQQRITRVPLRHVSAYRPETTERDYRPTAERDADDDQIGNDRDIRRRR